MSHRVLVVEDERTKRTVLVDTLAAAGFDVAGAADGLTGMEMIRDDEWDLVLLDLRLPGMDGQAILEETRRLKPQTSVIVMTAYGSIETAVEAMKLGAFDFLAKPFTADELLVKMERLFEHRAQAAENRDLKRALATNYQFHRMVARSKAMRDLFERIRLVADSDAAVLVHGETGTGKELVAETIHQNSPRRSGPLIKVSCVSLSETIIESELFGHEKGAFSGAIRSNPGRFELADKGTLFLDDVDDMPLSLQPKLLRVLQSREFERVGSERTCKVDVRLIAATKMDVSKLIEQGRFREDLYYRLNTVSLTLPPLRERKDELAPLVEHFAAKYSKEEPRRFTAGALRLLKKHDWPGNVRELEHVVEAALVMTREGEIEASNLPEEFLRKVAVKADVAKMDLKGDLAEIERETINQALAKFDGNISKAAKHLNIARSTLRDRLKRLGIKPSR
jgi:two-component system response regulator AtoC